MSAASSHQLVYAVRLWFSGPEDQPVWRATVQNPITGERHIFADLQEFFAFIQESTQASAALDAGDEWPRPTEDAA